MRETIKQAVLDIINVHESVLTNRLLSGRFSPKVFTELFELDDDEIHEYLADNEHTPAEILEKLATSEWPCPCLVAQNVALPLETLVKLSEDSDLYWCVLQNPNLPTEIIEKIYNDLLHYDLKNLPPFIDRDEFDTMFEFIIVHPNVSHTAFIGGFDYIVKHGIFDLCDRSEEYKIDCVNKITANADRLLADHACTAREQYRLIKVKNRLISDLNKDAET